MNQILTLMAFSLLLLVPLGNQNAFAGTMVVFVESTTPSPGGLIVTIAGSGAAVSQQVIITIFDELNNEITELSIFSTGTGEFSTVWLVPTCLDGGTYTIIVEDSFSEAETDFVLDQVSDGECPTNGGEPPADDEFTVFVDSITPSPGGKIVTIKGTGAALSQQVIITIFDELNNEITELSIFSTGTGEFSTVWIVPEELQDEVFTIIAQDPLNEAETTFTCADQVIGGEIIPIETTSLLLANAQSYSWMLPVTLSILGIGIFVVSRRIKPENQDPS